MKLLWKIFAVSLLVCCQVSRSQNAANVSHAPASPNPCSARTSGSGVEILSNVAGVDFEPFLKQWFSITDRNWIRFMPKEAKPPTLAKGKVQIGVKIQPDGKVARKDIVMEAPSGNPKLDHAAWKAIRKSKYPPLPKEFHGPYLKIRGCFEYNMQSTESPGGDKAPKSE
jgi:TonB family protein